MIFILFIDIGSLDVPESSMDWIASPEETGGGTSALPPGRSGKQGAGHLPRGKHTKNYGKIHHFSWKIYYKW